MTNSKSYTTVFTSKVLIKANSKGTYNYWSANVLYDREEYNYLVSTNSWSYNLDGTKSKIKASIPYLITGKNIGKKNETTALEQSYKEIDSLILRKRNRGYRFEGEDEDNIFYPMLAHTYDEKRISFPCFIQPKLDGVRAIYKKDGGLFSRQGKPLNIYININQDKSEFILDGELILPKSYSFQDTIKAIKNKEDKDRDKVIYWIYDLYNINNPLLTYKERYILIKNIVTKNSQSNIKLISSYHVETLSSIHEYHQQFVADGYEGSIIRLDTKYDVGQRSYSLLKLKDMRTDEFEIVDIAMDKEGAAIFICKESISSNTFNVRPAMSLQERRTILLNPNIYIGQLLTVQYQDRTDSNIPRFPVGLCIRNYE